VTDAEEGHLAMTTNPAERPGRRSAFPPDVSDLMPAARAFAAELAARGEKASRNTLMAKLHIGAPKARAVLAFLREEPASRPLHLVTDDAGTPAELHEEPAELDAADVDQADKDQADDAGPAGDAHDQAVTDDQPSTASEPADQPTEPEPTAADPAPARPVRRRVPVWPVVALTLPALVAIWSGWVSLGAMAGFGIVHPLPGIADHLTLNTAITLPIGVEVYAAYALWVWLSGGVPEAASTFAKWSALVSLAVGAAGQVTYHLLAGWHVQHAPWPITMLVACLPVAVLGMGAALAHLVGSNH
jgi:hypothetical protein